jgi:hypothetical protein
VIELTLIVLSDLKDQCVEPPSHPTDHAILLRVIGTAVLIVRALKNLQRLFEPNTALRVLPQPQALSRIEVEAPKWRRIDR